MNIVLLTTGCFPYGGAPETIVRNMAKGLQENHNQVEVVRFRGKRFNYDNDLNIKSSDYLFSKPFKNEFSKFIELIISIAYIPFFVFQRKFISKDEAIILYGFEYSYHIAPLIIFSKLLKIKCVRFITDSYRKTTIMPVWWKYPKYFSYMRQIRIYDKYLDGVVVLSNFLLKQSIKNGVKQNKITLIPHFIE